MSSINLPKSVHKYLGFGTKFIPKKPPDSSLIKPSIDDFNRRIRIKELFKDKPNNNFSFNPIFHIKSSWIPPPSDSILIEDNLLELYNKLSILNSPQITLPYTNKLNHIVPKSFNDFIHHPDILIKPSDKNLGLTILDKKWYLHEGFRQLHDTNFYRVLNRNTVNSDQFLTTIKGDAMGIISLLKSPYCLNIFNKQIEKFLLYTIGNYNTLPTFHLLPKIHKTPLVGRPIVPSHSWITSGFSVYADTLLQQYFYHAHYIIKDTKTLIQSLDSITLNGKQTWFVTGDVSSMYTNIPTDTNAFNIVANFLVEYCLISEAEEPAFIEVLRFIMTNNYFLFNGIPFHQTSGIAMGTACAPAYANIFMEYTEMVFFRKYDTPLFYGRYIDDILMIFQGTEDELKSLLQAFDTDRLHSNTLKITWTYSPKSVDFLDLVISSSNDKIAFCVHQKTLNKYLYIPFCSYHPPESKTGFIKAELIRYVRNSSTYSAFVAIAHKFFLRLRLRGYPPRYLLWVFRKVHYRDRPKYLMPSIKDYNERLVPFVTTYNPIWESPHLKQSLKQFNANVPHYKPIIAFKRNKNIGDFINKANVRKLRGTRFRATPAGKRWLPPNSNSNLQTKKRRF